MAGIKGAPYSVVQRLSQHYRLVQLGIGVHKTPDRYGAFPIDPYSHTPRMAGVQQPGMTGQVKEDIISRLFELGLKVSKGQITFHPMVLKRTEFFEPQTVDPHSHSVPNLRFTFCKIPITYLIDNNDGIDLIFINGDKVHFISRTIDRENSLAVFNRSGIISEIHVHLTANMFFNS
jgi:hypothetical protein